MASLVIQQVKFTPGRGPTGVAYETVEGVIGGIRVTPPGSAAVVFGPIAVDGLVSVSSLFGQVLIRKVTGSPVSPSLTQANSLWLGVDHQALYEMKAGESIAAVTVAYT